jgi:hypothetical protein
MPEYPNGLLSRLVHICSYMVLPLILPDCSAIYLVPFPSCLLIGLQTWRAWPSRKVHAGHSLAFVAVTEVGDILRTSTLALDAPGLNRPWSRRRRSSHSDLWSSLSKFKTLLGTPRCTKTMLQSPTVASSTPSTGWRHASPPS